MNLRLDLRLESAKLPVMVESITPDNVVSLSKDIEKYLLGDAELPETYDQHKMLKD